HTSVAPSAASPLTAPATPPLAPSGVPASAPATPPLAPSGVPASAPAGVGGRAIAPPGTPTGAQWQPPPGGGRGTVRAPLGLICGARSGDKGGNANVGLWTTGDAEYAWLRGYLTTGRFRELLPEAAGLAVERHELPLLRAVNFVVTGLLGDGVAS